jgi:poly(glycerol-phosphate) alpha-glucosyltransferase
MLPEGRYLSCAFAVSPDAGGQTRALLLRNRILAARGGVRPTLLTFNAAPDYPRRREVLLERGLLTEAIELVNIYDHYRELDWDDEPGERPLAGLRRVA